MEAVVLPPVKFRSSSFLKPQITPRMKISCGVNPLQHVTRSFPGFCTQASDRFCPRALFRSDSFDAADDILLSERELEVTMDPGMFEEVFPTFTKQKEAKPKPGRQRSSKAALFRDSTSKSILIPDEWISVQKHHLRTKKERKQEVLALQILRAREREEEDRAVKEEAARAARARLSSSASLELEVSKEEKILSTDEGHEHTSVDGYSVDRWEEAEVEEEEAFLDEFEPKAAVGKVSGRARPKDYRSGLEFSSLEEVAERLRQVTEMGSSSDSDRGSVEAVEDEQAEIVKLTPEEKAMLRNRNLNFATVSSRSWSPLHTLAAAGQVFLAAELIKRGVEVDALDKEGFTPIHRAIQSGRKMMVRLLLKAGADPHVRDRDGATYLHYAAQTGNHEIAKLLLRDDVDVDVNSTDKDGWTPLHVAVQSGRTELIRCLINRGADMNQANNDGNSPFDLSLTFGNCFRFYDTIKFMKRKESEFQNRRKFRDTEMVHDE